MFRKREEKGCGECDFNTVSEYELQRHKKERHATVFDFVCDACGMDFISQVGFELSSNIFSARWR